MAGNMTKVSITNERLLTAERLRRLLSYDPETGVFTWRSPGTGRRVSGIAGCLGGTGYWHINLDNRIYPAQRLAWLYQTGEWPAADIDHINRDRADNRWCNLRAATKSQNSSNRCADFNNTAGFKGVTWYKARRKWQAMITVNGKHIYLGVFDTPHQAYANYCLAARKHHGDFARVYEPDQLIIPRKVFERRVLLKLLAATQSQFTEAA
jgi:hypothetical protein